MVFTISAQARREVIEATRVRYLAAARTEKRRILDGFVAITGYHRKHAIRVLRARRPVSTSKRSRPRVYDDAVRAALAVLRQVSGRRSGKRLAPRLPLWVAALERDGRLSITASIRARLLAVSPSTIDRLFAAERAARAPATRPRPVAPRRRPPRVDFLDEVWPQVAAWLDAEPRMTAPRVLQRLQATGHGVAARQLRTLQRRIRAWRDRHE